MTKHTKDDMARVDGECQPDPLLTASGHGLVSHAPTPWVVTAPEGRNRWGVETFSVCADNSPQGMAMEGDGFSHQCVARVKGASDDEAEANADFIVRCVNAHDALVEALKRAQAALIWCSGSPDFNEGGQAREGWIHPSGPLAVIARIDALLAKAEGATHGA